MFQQRLFFGNGGTEFSKKDIANLKTEKSVERNVTRAINFLLGKERFVGRDKP